MKNTLSLRSDKVHLMGFIRKTILFPFLGVKSILWDLYMKKQEFDETLKRIGLSRQEFADMTELAYSTIGNWQDEKKPVPGWVKSWLDNYVKAKDMDKVVEAVKPHIK